MWVSAVNVGLRAGVPPRVETGVVLDTPLAHEIGRRELVAVLTGDGEEARRGNRGPSRRGTTSHGPPPSLRRDVQTARRPE